MTRIYELMFIIDPRVSEDDALAVADEYKKMITEGGAEVVKEEHWGRRKLAYPIQKLTEGRYILFYVTCEGETPLASVEMRMNQNDKVLRYLTVRTDREVDLEEPAAEEPAETAEEEN